MSEMQKREPTLNPRTLFLQDREGRVAGELNLRTMLDALVAHVPNEGTEKLHGSDLRTTIRQSLESSIETLAAKELPRVDRNASLGEMIAYACRHGAGDIPVVDKEDRLVGIVRDATLISSLCRCLQLNPVTVMEELAEKPVEGSVTYAGHK